MKKKLLFAVLVILMVFALSRFDLQGLLDSVGRIPLWSVAVLVCLQIVTQLLLNVQWHQIAKFTGIPLTFGNMLYVNCQGAVVDSITPGVKFGGEVTRALQISRTADCSGERAAALVAVQKLFSLSSFFIINLFAVGFVIGNVPALQATFLKFLIYGILTLFLLLFSCIFFIPHRMRDYFQSKGEPRFSWVRRLRSFFTTMLGQVVSIRKDAAFCVALFVLSIVLWLFYPVKMYLLAVQVMPDAPVLFVGAITFVSYMVAMIPVFPGGLGGFEGTMTGLLFTVGFMQSDALVITVIFRFVTFWLVMLLSLVFIGLRKVYSRAKGFAITAPVFLPPDDAADP